MTKEEVGSTLDYLQGYKPGQKSIDEQIRILKELLPDIGSVNEKLTKQPLPNGAEDYFAVVRWQMMGSSYEMALKNIIYLMERTLKSSTCYNYYSAGGFRNWCEIDRIRLRTKTKKSLEVLSQQQEGNNILVIPAQFGKLHIGRSVHRALEIMPDTEFGADPFMVACMLLTHPERLQYFYHPWIDCAGAEYDCNGNGSFGAFPLFNFSEHDLEFSYSPGNAHWISGSVSGFLL